jgi:hypothetical protein
LIAVAAYAFSTGFRFYEDAGIWPLSLPLGLGLYMIGLAAMVAAFLVSGLPGKRARTLIGLALMLCVTTAVAHQIESANPRYGTDAIAFSHASAEILLAGDNPYQFEGEPAGLLAQFAVPESFITRKNNGETIDRLVSYPGGHVLAYAGGMWLGAEDMRWVTFVFQIAALTVIWLSLSPLGQLLAPVALLVEPNLALFFTSGGVTDWLWVLPLALAAICMKRRWFVYGGIAFGLACAMKQQPWFAVPFAIVWVLNTVEPDADSPWWRARVGGFLAGLATGFILPNFPFILWDPAAWAKGTLAPVLGDLVPDGQGFSLLSARGFSSLADFEYSAIAGAVLVGLVILYVKYHGRLRDALWVLPPVALFFSYRSLHNYFIFWIPIALLWLDQEQELAGRRADVTPPEAVRGAGWRLPPWLFVLLPLTVVLTIRSLGDPPLVVEAVVPTVENGIVTALDVRVANRTEEALEPVFEIYWGRYSAVWVSSTSETVDASSSHRFHVVPGSSASIPPLVEMSDGRFAPSPFRVRVNPVGYSRYGASQIVQVEAIRIDFVNPGFRFWSEGLGGVRSPFGWTETTRQASGASLGISPLGSDGGAVLSVTVEQAGAGDWAEVGLVQETDALAACLDVDLTFTGEYSATADGAPLAAVGLQVSQNQRSIWFVPSSVQHEVVVDLQDGTRIVEVPAHEGEWQVIQLDVARHAIETGVRIGDSATLKLFNAVQDTQNTHQEVRVRNIEADC